jgi:hypothetical protein
MQWASSTTNSDGSGLRDRVEHLRLAELLGREEEELDVAGAQRLEGRLARLLRLAAVGLHGAAGAGVLEQARDLVALQGDERADHDGRAVEQQGRHLVDGALARAGGHDDERVAPGEDVLHGLELAGTELVPAEGLAGGALRGAWTARVQGELRGEGWRGSVALADELVEPADRAVAGALLVEEVDVAVVERREERLPADVLEPVSLVAELDPQDARSAALPVPSTSAGVPPRDSAQALMTSWSRVVKLAATVALLVSRSTAPSLPSSSAVAPASCTDVSVFFRSATGILLGSGRVVRESPRAGAARTRRQPRVLRACSRARARSSRCLCGRVRARSAAASRSSSSSASRRCRRRSGSAECGSGRLTDCAYPSVRARARRRAGV